VFCNASNNTEESRAWCSSRASQGSMIKGGVDHRKRPIKSRHRILVVDIIEFVDDMMLTLSAIQKLSCMVHAPTFGSMNCTTSTSLSTAQE